MMNKHKSACVRESATSARSRVWRAVSLPPTVFSVYALAMSASCVTVRRLQTPGGSKDALEYGDVWPVGGPAAVVMMVVVVVVVVVGLGDSVSF